MDTSNGNAVLIASLPKGWKGTTAKKFTCSVGKIEKIAYGTREDFEVMGFLLSLAEQEKTDRVNKQIEIDKRLSALAAS